MNSIKQWYVVYTRVRWEKKVTGLLTRKQLECYCPMTMSERQWSDRNKEICEPLFASYVFVYVSEKDHIPIKQTEGVLSLVHWLGKPAVIKPAEIDAIREFVRMHRSVSVKKTQVQTDGHTWLSDAPADGSITLSLPSLGCEISARDLSVTECLKQNSHEKIL